MSELGKVIEELEMLAGVPHASRVYVKCDELQALIAAAKRAEQAEAEVGRLREALTKLRDCDWTVGVGDRMDPVRDIARKALTERRTLTPPPTANEGATTLKGAGGEVRAEGGEA